MLTLGLNVAYITQHGFLKQTSVVIMIAFFGGVKNDQGKHQNRKKSEKVGERFLKSEVGCNTQTELVKWVVLVVV